MSHDRIYIRFKGKTLGPLTDQKVRDLVRRGQITRMHELSSDGLAWQRAEELGDYFGSRKGKANESNSSVAVAQSKGSRATKASVPSAGSTPIPGSVPDGGVEWYAYVNGENQGPLDSQALNQWIQTGDIDGETLVWRAGYDEWRPAGDCLPEQFASAPSPTNSHSAGSRRDGGSIAGAGPTISADVRQGFTSQRPWVLILSVLGLVWSGLSVVYFVTTMVVGANADWIPGGGSRSAIYGLSGLIVCGIQIAGEILLLNYATSLKTLEQRRDMTSLGRAAKRLRTFWKYCSIVVIVILVLLIGTAVLILVMAAAAVDAGA